MGDVAVLLRQRDVPFAVIGAAAMAVHGVTRSTRALDLLVITAECLTADFWASVRDQGVSVSLRRGGADDPLAGVARFTLSGENPLDLIVGKSAWQAGVLARARDATIQGARLGGSGARRSSTRPAVRRLGPARSLDGCPGAAHYRSRAPPGRHVALSAL